MNSTILKPFYGNQLKSSVQSLKSLLTLPQDSADEATTISLKLDQDHLWHPYTSMVKPTRVWPVVSASGCQLQLEDGRRLVDGMASWWCAIHGYNVPELNAAATKQLAQMSHATWRWWVGHVAAGSASITSQHRLVFHATRKDGAGD